MAALDLCIVYKKEVYLPIQIHKEIMHDFDLSMWEIKAKE